MRQAVALVTLLVAAASLVGCIHDRRGDPRKHYASFNVAPPEGDAVEVCHAYTCKMKTTFYFHKSDIAKLAASDKANQKGRYAIRGASRHRLRDRAHRDKGRRQTRDQRPGRYGVRGLGRSHAGRLRG